MLPFIINGLVFYENKINLMKLKKSFNGWWMEGRTLMLVHRRKTMRNFVAAK
jgi:hypothetical protein